MNKVFIVALLASVAMLVACPPNRSADTASADSPVTTAPPPRSSPRTEIPELAVVAVSADAITIDGRLTDEVWSRANETGWLVSAGGGEYVSDSPVQARTWAAWSPDALYVAMVVEDDDPVSPFSRDDVDPHVWAEASGVEVMLQPGDPGDNTHYYEIQVDVAEALWSTQFDDYNDPVTGDGDALRFGHQDWDPPLERAVRVNDRAGNYIVEMALPWSAVTSERTAVPPAAGDVWRANFYSFRDGQQHSLAGRR